MKRYKLMALLASVPLAAGAVVASTGQSGADERPHVQRIVVPEADQFTPFAATVRVGDVVQWVNRDTDDHTVVSDDAFNTAGHRGVDLPLVGTDNNHGRPGTVALRFNHPGTFVYYCRFHSHLDANNQPVAPGPDGGIQDTKGNFGTPMMGVIVVRGDGDH
jgi:plastocyanin